MKTLTIFAAIFSTIIFSVPFEARAARSPAPAAGHLVPDNDGKMIWAPDAHRGPAVVGHPRARKVAALPAADDVIDFGQPVQTPSEPRGRVSRRSGLTSTDDIQATGGRSSLCARAVGGLSCGCDTASYFGVRVTLYPNGKHDLDLAANWGRLRQSAGPCAGCAAWRRGHVMAITGGSPGAWRVKDFNSGRGQTHEYTVASFPRSYRFAVPADIHMTARRLRVAHR